MCVGSVAQVDGCTDPDACNFDATATNDDGSCFSIGDACDDGDAATTNDVYDAYCACVGTIPQVDGCTDSDACNYDPVATNDDGSCTVDDCEGICGGPAVAGSACDDGDADTENDVYDAYCNCAGTFVQVDGCTDPAALNYDATANTDDGSCFYTCYSGAGTVMVNSFCVCEGGQAIADADDFILIPGQSVYYVYHTDGTITDANMPMNVVSLGSFINNDSTVTGTIYVTAFGATSDGNGGPDLSDPCLTYSNTVAITMLEPIVIYTEEFCDEDKGEFTYTFTVCGGLPEKTPGDMYQITSAYFNGPVSKGDTITVGPITSNTSYTLTATDGEGCSVTVTNDYMCFPVPVTLISFNGEALQDGNLLKWSTATEDENDFFTLFMSKDADGAGTAVSLNAYSFLDESATSGVTYYKLMQTDFDGTVEDLGTISLKRKETITIGEVYPSPVAGSLFVSVSLENDKDISIEIFNVNGQNLTSETIAGQNGLEVYSVSTEDLAPGIYNVRISAGDYQTSQKFIKE